VQHVLMDGQRFNLWQRTMADHEDEAIALPAASR
jgi:hypothetical protein